ncbi:hypothetical protein SAMN02910317_00364 [Ruminococcaceae bacterium FB2012]|nr:hypothetical protein SAMN02910317_00364 [Ruminococcaceae bacterium FB2012]
MACFLAPAAEAVVTTVITVVVKKKEKRSEKETASESAVAKKLRFSEKLRWLNWMLWGGSLLLAFEHIWHGEVVPWFPFLTRASDAADRAEMLREIATNGTAMCLLVTLVWGIMVAVASRLEKAAPADEAKEEVVS